MKYKRKRKFRKFSDPRFTSLSNPAPARGPEPVPRPWSAPGIRTFKLDAPVIAFPLAGGGLDGLSTLQDMRGEGEGYTIALHKR